MKGGSDGLVRSVIRLKRGKERGCVCVTETEQQRKRKKQRE